MRMTGVRAFTVAFFLTAAVLAPLVLGLYLISQWQNQKWVAEEKVAHSESNIIKQMPQAKHDMQLLVCVADETPSFVLVSLDAQNNNIKLAAIPAQGVLINETQTPTLAESYAAAGPARVVQLLNNTLGTDIQKYLAIPSAKLEPLLRAFGTVRVGLTGAMTAEQLAVLGEEGSVKTWDVEQMQLFLEAFDKAAQTEASITPMTQAAVRSTFWESFLRDKLAQLPANLPDALRKESSSLLSDISAVDLVTLQETLEFLANGKANIDMVTLPGDWNRTTNRYEFNDETLQLLNASFSAMARGAQRASSNAP